MEQKEYIYIESDFLSSRNVYFSADDCIEFFNQNAVFIYKGIKKKYLYNDLLHE